METQDFKAMISLLDDSDTEVVEMVTQKLKGLGAEVIPMLEREWSFYGENPKVQNSLGNIIKDLQTNGLLNHFLEWKDTGGQDLLRGLWLVSKLAKPDLEFKKLGEEINKIYTEIWVKSYNDMHPLDLLKIMNEVVFKQMGFTPNIKNFHAPQNSLFNEVLEQKTGNPVSLSCIYILLAQKLDIPLYGVNLPNIFVTIFDMPGYRFYVNPYNEGQIFQQKDIDEYLKHMNINPRDEYYNACSNMEIIVRTLNNLAFAYQKSGNLKLEGEVNRILRVI